MLCYCTQTLPDVMPGWKWAWHGVVAHIRQDRGGGASAGTIERCPELQTCIPLSRMQIAENFGVFNVSGTPASLVGAVGVCTGSIEGGGYLLPNAMFVPPPM